MHLAEHLQAMQRQPEAQQLEGAETAASEPVEGRVHIGVPAGAAANAATAEEQGDRALPGDKVMVPASASMPERTPEGKTARGGTEPSPEHTNSMLASDATGLSTIEKAESHTGEAAVGVQAQRAAGVKPLRTARSSAMRSMLGRKPNKPPPVLSPADTDNIPPELKVCFKIREWSEASILICMDNSNITCINTS